MPQLTFPRSPNGWIVPVLDGLDHTASLTVAQSGIPVPTPILGAAQIDSGSNVTCVSDSILQRLPLIPRGTLTTQTVAGSASVRMFDVSLSIIPASGSPGPMLTIRDLLIMELSQPLPDVDVLVGLDVLDRCQTIMDGPQQLLTLVF